MHLRQVSFFERRRLRPESAEGLLGAAAPLLIEIGVLRTQPSRLDPDDPVAGLAEGLEKFCQQAARSGVGMDKISAAQAVLRLLIRESLLLHPSMGSPEHPPWQELLSGSLDREAFGAMLVSQFRCSKRDHDLLRFLNTVVLLGLEDSLRSTQMSRAELQQLVAGLSSAVERRSSGAEKGLSPGIRAVTAPGGSLKSRVPLWVGLSMAGLLLLACYHGAQVLRDAMFNAVIVDAEFIARPPL